jgi:valyl-tRNA synthetase
MNLPPDYKMPSQCPANLSIFDHWILKEYKNAIALSSTCLEEFRFADYAQSVYDFFWKDFCDNYLELSKTSLKDDAHAETTRWVLNFVFEGALKLLHPIMPFITEELYSLRSNSTDDQSSGSSNSLIITASWPDAKTLPATDDGAWAATELMLHLIYKIRNLRGELLIPPGEKFKAALIVKDDSTKEVLLAQKNHIMNLARLSDFHVYGEKDAEKNSVTGISTPMDFGKLVIDVHHLIDAEKEKIRLAKEIENFEKYVKVIDQKLSNKDFVERAPADLISEENRKKIEATNKLEQLQEFLKYFV